MNDATAAKKIAAATNDVLDRIRSRSDALYLLREAYVDLASARARITRLQHAMIAVETALLANPEADDIDRGLAHVLAGARGVR